MSLESTPKLEFLPCGGVLSTSFVYSSVATQAAANSVYAGKSTLVGNNNLNARSANVGFTFKTDAERMQYLIGKIGTVPKCTGF